MVLGDDDVVAERSFGNLVDVQTTLRRELSAYDVLRNDWVVFTDETLPGAAGEAGSDTDEGPADAAGETAEAPSSDEEAGS